jgi:hypothetical protein
MTPNDKRPERFEELLSADEGPMRRELMRQIAALELKLSKLRRDHAPFEQLPELLQRGPALLSTEQLEQVRDELLALLDDLRGRVTRRFAAGIVDPPADADDPLAGLLDPWADDPSLPWYRRLVHRLRRAFRDPRAR